jgi:hypothetical protein
MSHIGLKKLYEEVKSIPGKDHVKIDPTERTPEILLDRSGENGNMKFTGRSLPDHAKSFYNPILVWIDEYFRKPHEKTIVRFDLEYFNTASSKMLLQIIKKLEKLKAYGKELVIEWCYMEDDEDILESGETFQDLADVEFDFISYY